MDTLKRGLGLLWPCVCFAALYFILPGGLALLAGLLAIINVPVALTGLAMTVWGLFVVLTRPQDTGHDREV